ncbi:hypothetical protein Afil01_21070 [Actinorhabdospora filicis]|uniref:N-acetyltransferase domain-containing protein n=1 Tax=Actinorhabdospora filicis TaxID=1785913 RepID=A0A9W6WA54_9ACTN|nr:GNAT family N-acetyltransferase [Actinorhabdospora filicis]GLZ77300.1 hypothetical protein Afil01_21070 [Actinorhabdospora filicis]
MDKSIQDYTRANVAQGGLGVNVGPFLCRFDPDSAIPGLNYAIPADGAAPTAGELGELHAAFAERGRTPRFEFVPSRSPRLAAILEEHGYTVSHRGRIMATEAVLDVPAPEGVTIVDALDEDAWYGAAAVQFPAFGEAVPGREGAISWKRRSVSRGGAVAVALVDGEYAGAGEYTPPIGGVCEVAGIAVGEKWRRRGIASAITAHLTRRALGEGVRTAWLDPADEGAQRVYARAGYVYVGESLHMTR